MIRLDNANEKKAKKKAAKAAKKVQEEAKKGQLIVPTYHFQVCKAHTQIAPANSNEDKGLEATPEKDEDPDGQKLLSATDGLERAAKLLAPITSLVKDNFDVWIATYDVAIRRSEHRVQRIIL